MDCGISFEELKPRSFSFNSPFGACPVCNGLGALQLMDPKLVIPDDSLSIRNGAIPGWRRGPRHLIMYYNLLLRKIAECWNCPDMLTTPFRDLPEKIRENCAAIREYFGYYETGRATDAACDYIIERLGSRRKFPD